MKTTIIAQPLTKAAFAPYGSVMSLIMMTKNVLKTAGISIVAMLVVMILSQKFKMTAVTLVLVFSVLKNAIALLHYQ